MSIFCLSWTHGISAVLGWYRVSSSARSSLPPGLNYSLSGHSSLSPITCSPALATTSIYSACPSPKQCAFVIWPDKTNWLKDWKYSDFMSFHRCFKDNGLSWVNYRSCELFIHHCGQPAPSQSPSSERLSSSCTLSKPHLRIYLFKVWRVYFSSLVLTSSSVSERIICQSSIE